MVTHSTAKFLISIFAIGSTLVLANEVGLSQTKPATNTTATKFLCVRQGTGYATIAQRNDKKTPIITWNKKLNSQYTPEKRCLIVSERLTKAVMTSGGRLKTLRMTHGIVNSNPVICYIRNPEEECNTENLLLTLNQSERGKEGEILKQLMKISVTANTAAITRSAQEQRTVVELGTAIEASFTQSGTETQLQESTPLTAPSNDKSI